MNSDKLKIAVLGGTGNIGEGMVLRLALQNLMAEGVKNEVIIGSRSKESANEAAKKLYRTRTADLTIQDRHYRK